MNFFKRNPIILVLLAIILIPLGAYLKDSFSNKKSPTVGPTFINDGLEEKKEEKLGIYTKVMSYKYCECEDYCMSSFIDESGNEYDFGNPSMGDIQFNCNMNGDGSPTYDKWKDKKFKIKYQKDSTNHLKILGISLLDNSNSQINSSTTSIKNFHDVANALERQTIGDIEPNLGKPDVEGTLDCVAYQCCEYFVYFDKVNSDGEIKHLVIMTFKGDIVSIQAIHEGEKVYSIFGHNTAAWNDYIKVSRTGLTSNSPQFTKTPLFNN